MNDLISRREAIYALSDAGIINYAASGDGHGMIHAINVIKALPPTEPTLYGYNIEHLKLIAYMLQKENLPPERVAEALTDIGRIIEMVRDEFLENLKRSVEHEKR